MKTSVCLPNSSRVSTGISGLDRILCGGFPKDRLYLLQGEPGTGKTTLSLQFLLEGARLGEKCLYITFSETKEELIGVANSHGWDLSQIALLELSSIEDQLRPEAQNTVFYPSEVEMSQTTKVLISEVERVKPTRIVFDSVSEMRMLAETPLRYRRQMLSLKQFFAGKKCTVLLLDDLTASPKDLQVQSIVHGVVNLQKIHPEYGDERRRLSIVKVRGVQYAGGHHDYVIRKGGLRIFPRLVSSDYEDQLAVKGIASSGIQELDDLLGEGLDRGTSNLFLGPAGTGKSTLAIQYASAAADRGEAVSLYLFEESIDTMLMRATALGIPLKTHLDSGLIKIQKIDPAQLSPGEFADIICKSVLQNDTRMIVIDSLNGYMHAMPEEEFLLLQLHELLAFLGSRGVVTLMVLAQQGILGSMATPVDLTYLADTVMITRYFETRGSIKKAVSVIKKRSGYHESTIREFTMSPQGIQVGPPLEAFQGVLTGVPSLVKGMQHV